jgi:hypothetical protein
LGPRRWSFSSYRSTDEIASHALTTIHRGFSKLRRQRPPLRAGVDPRAANHLRLAFSVSNGRLFCTFNKDVANAPPGYLIEGIERSKIRDDRGGRQDGDGNYELRSPELGVMRIP